MKYLLLFPVFISQAQLCQRQEEFSACSTKAATQISLCSSEVSGPVTSSLYGCLCKQNKAMMDCYELCLDGDPELNLDPQLVQQKESQMQSVNAACAVSVATTTSTSTASATATRAITARSTTVTSTADFEIPTSEIDSSTAPDSSASRSPTRTGVAAVRTISTVGRSQPTGVVLDSASRDFALVAFIPMILAMI